MDGVRVIILFENDQCYPFGFVAPAPLGAGAPPPLAAFQASS